MRKIIFSVIVLPFIVAGMLFEIIVDGFGAGRKLIVDFVLSMGRK